MKQTEALKLARSVISSINQGKQHRLTMNDENVFWQREEWVRWALDEVLPLIDEALAQPEQEPVAWKLVPTEPTEEMLKAMDECSTEGYDERLYAGHAASVYMAAIDAATTPPQRKPLTDEQMNQIWFEQNKTHGSVIWRFARAIEAAHGIKE